MTSQHVLGAGIIAASGTAVSNSFIISGIITLIIAGIILLQNKKRDNDIKAEINRAKKQIIEVVLKGDRREKPRNK